MADRPFRLSLVEGGTLALTLEGAPATTVTVTANQTHLQRVYVTAPQGTAQAQAERTAVTLRVEDMSSGDIATEATVFNGRDN